MRQVVTTRTGGIEVLKVEERPDPQPAPGEVAIRVRAAGLNFADILSRQGLYPDSPPKPCTGVGESFVVEINWILSNEYDTESKRAPLFQQSKQRQL